MPAVGDHYRPATTDHRPGVYRVVGVTDDVALLRVADAEGRRRHTGEVIHVGVSELQADFEEATGPNGSPAIPVRNLLSGVYWSVRRFL